MTDTAHDRITKMITDNDVFLFMKGDPTFPQCGFSSVVAQVMQHLGLKFESFNVLSDAEVREGVKEFSDWPTIPQLYVKGEFVGGCDIVKEMFQSGELQTLLDDKGIAHS